MVDRLATDLHILGAVAQLAEYRIVYPVVAGSNPVGLAVVVVAQLVERWIVVPKVEGSSPFNHPRRGPGAGRPKSLPCNDLRGCPLKEG